jgi:hypothetical protein
VSVLKQDSIAAVCAQLVMLLPCGLSIPRFSAEVLVCFASGAAASVGCMLFMHCVSNEGVAAGCAADQGACLALL